MSKPVKNVMTQEYVGRYGQLGNACVVSVIGLDAVSTNQLRGELFRKNLELHVVKNSLARRAFAGTAMEPLGQALEGPCALVTGEGSAIDLAKTLVDLQKNYPKVELKIGILDGDAELIDVAQLAKMKGRQELLADLAGMIHGPAAKLAGCLVGPGGRLAGCFKAIAEKQEGSEAA